MDTLIILPSIDRSEAMKRPYYGWVMVVALGITELISYGVLYYAFTLFIEPMQAELGWSRAEITGAYSLSQVIIGFASVPLGFVFDRYGTRWVMTAGSVLASVLVYAWSTVQTLPVYYLIWIGLGLAMAAVLYEAAFWVVTAWFSRKRGRALTVLTFIAGFSSVLFLPIVEWLVRTFGWRESLVMQALLLALVTIPIHLLLIRRRPQDMGLEVDGETSVASQSTAENRENPAPASVRQTMQQPLFWWVSAAFFFNTIVYMALSVHLKPLLVEQGFASETAALAVGAVGLLSLPGRLIFTLLGDYLPRRYVITGIFLSMTVALLVLSSATTVPLMIVFVVLYGAGFGAIVPGRAALMGELYDIRQYGRLNGILTLILTLARAGGPVVAGFIYDEAGSYAPLITLLLVVSALSVLASWMIRAPRAVAIEPVSG